MIKSGSGEHIGKKLCIEAPPSVSFYSTTTLTRPDSPAESTFEPFMGFVRGKKCGILQEQQGLSCKFFEYWGDRPPEEQWRDGITKEVVTDESIITVEEAHRKTVILEDAPTAGTPRHDDVSHSRGITVRYLLAMTFALDLWNWSTWEVVASIVRPATAAHGRCRFADLPYVQPHTGPATVFISHCWGGRWGDLVAAVVGGAREDRIVWIDVFAVRQWPGNSADINFRGVIQRSRGVLVAASPQAVVSERYMSYKEQRKEYLASDYHAAALGVLPFCRLWCIVELFAAARSATPIFFRVCSATNPTDSEKGLDGANAKALVGSTTKHIETRGGFYSLLNFSNMVDLELASCTVPEDRVREMAAIRAFKVSDMELADGTNCDEGGVAYLERIVRQCLAAGSIAAKLSVYEVDAFACGEPEALDTIPTSRAVAALTAACASGHLTATQRILTPGGNLAASIGDLAEQWEPLWLAAANAHVSIVELLLAHGALVDHVDPKMGRTPLWKAALNGHAEMVLSLEARGHVPNADDDSTFVRFATDV